MTTYTLVDMMRHGEPIGGRRYRGRMDDPLSEKGWRQMRAATAGARPWTVIVSSPLSRCLAFAESLSQETGLPLYIDDRLREVGFGAWEGRSPDELKAEAPNAVFDFKRDPIGRRPAGAEPLEDFQERVSAAFESIVRQHAGGHPLVVAHAGVMRLVMGHVLGMPVAHVYRIQVGPAAIARFRIEQKGQDCFTQLLHLTPGVMSSD